MMCLMILASGVATGEWFAAVSPLANAELPGAYFSCCSRACVNRGVLHCLCIGRSCGFSVDAEERDDPQRLSAATEETVSVASCFAARVSGAPREASGVARSGTWFSETPPPFKSWCKQQRSVLRAPCRLCDTQYRALVSSERSASSQCPAQTQPRQLLRPKSRIRYDCT